MAVVDHHRAFPLRDAICDELEDVYGGAETLENLGLAHEAAGAARAARSAWLQAEDRFRAAGDEDAAKRMHRWYDGLDPDTDC